VAIGTTISCCLGRQYMPVLSLYFLDVCGYELAIFLFAFALVELVAPLHLQWPLAKQFPTA